MELMSLLTLPSVAAAFCGTFLGVVIGMLPGLNGPIGVALLLPFTFSMDVSSALLLLGGLYMGSSYGGSISAILLNAPGTEVAAATAIEGYPMMRDGRGEEALQCSLIASTLGGLLGVVAMILCTPLLADIALRFGPPEMAVLALSGLAIIGMLSGADLWLGVGAGAFGVLLSTVGQDIMLGQLRNTFGVLDLEGGISLVPALVGFFAVSEIIVQMLRPKEAQAVAVVSRPAPFGAVLRDLLTKYRAALTKGSLLGILIGIMPGAGAAIATFIAYGEAKRGSKHPELYGKGYAEGIAAAESANNSAVCGSLVPLLALGIPGSTTCAIIYGALTIHGIIPGPRLMQTSGEFVQTFMLGMGLTVLFMFIIGRSGLKLFTMVLKIPQRMLMPCILIMCFVGAFSINNSMFDVALTCAFGMTGYFFKLARIPVAPAVLGLILGPIAEEGIRQCILMSRSQNINMIEYFMGRPIAVALLGILLCICWASWRSFKRTQAMGGKIDE